MRFSRFFTFGRSAPRPEAPPSDGLDAFHSEAPGASSRPPATRLNIGFSSAQLVPLLAILVVIEAVPAALWVYGAVRAAGWWPSTAAAAAPAPPTVLASLQPCTPALPPVSDSPSVVQGTAGRNRNAPESSASPGAAPAPGSLGGLIAVSAPVPMNILSRGRLIGTTQAETVMLPVGTHDLVFVSEETGYTTKQSVSVQAGKTSKVRLDAPNGRVNVNAVPWADVWIGNQRLGETPIGNLQLPVGPHEFVFRHPELGERRKTVLVTLREPARISMDMRTK